MRRARRTETEKSNILETVKTILGETKPMTLRQIYYQLVSRQVFENVKSNYDFLSGFLRDARKDGLISWTSIEDRTRRPRDVNMWDDVSDFIKTLKDVYRLDVWKTQEKYVVVWLEKDALSGIFEGLTNWYGVTLLVGRGYNSWSLKNQLAERFKEMKRETTVLYFGDFDPSGEDIVRDLAESFGFFGLSPKFVKVALNLEDVRKYRLPYDFAKKTDTRAKGFIGKYGDIAVELDALPVDVLRNKIIGSIESEMNIDALMEIKKNEKKERKRFYEHLKAYTT